MFSYFSVAHCQDKQTVLARALVAEAGWVAPTDHAGILHVLRWRAVRAGVPMATMATRYCRALQPHRRPVGRQRWIHGLGVGQPPHWPARLAWGRFLPLWEDVRKTVARFLRGHLADPCPGAIHFGLRTDPYAHRLTPVACSGATRVHFFRR